MSTGDGARAERPRGRYRAIVFDLDGTLMDSQMDFQAMRLAVVEIAGAHGLADGEIRTDVTLPEMMARAHAALAAQNATAEMREDFDGEVERRFDQIEMAALPRLKPMPGALEAVTSLRDQGFQLGVLTRSCRAYTLDALRRAGMDHLFLVTRSRDDPGPQKPDPRSLEWVLERLGALRSDAVYVGDRGLDKACALSAGVDFIGMVWPGDGEDMRDMELRRVGPSPRVHSFPELLDHIAQR